MCSCLPPNVIIIYYINTQPCLYEYSLKCYPLSTLSETLFTLKALETLMTSEVKQFSCQPQAKHSPQNNFKCKFRTYPSFGLLYLQTQQLFFYKKKRKLDYKIEAAAAVNKLAQKRYLPHFLVFHMKLFILLFPFESLQLFLLNLSGKSKHVSFT